MLKNMYSYILTRISILGIPLLRIIRDVNERGVILKEQLVAFSQVLPY